MPPKASWRVSPGAVACEEEGSFTSTAVLSREASHAAIVHERRGRPQVRLLYNALLLPAAS